MEDSEKEELSQLIKNVFNIPGVKDCTKSKMYRKQWLTSINFLLPLVIIGMTHGYSTILMKGLDPSAPNATSSMKVENGEIFRKPTIIVESQSVQTWIVSLTVLCMCPGCWILAIFGQVLGRKKVLLSSVGLSLVSWTTLVFAENLYYIFAGRCLAGFCSGILIGLVSVYQGECTVPKLRATLNAVHTVCFSAGIELSHAAGIWFHWRTVACLASLICVITLISNYFVPESPIWLLKKGKFRESIRSWTYFRGVRDLDELKSMYVSNLNNSSLDLKKKKQYSDSFFSPSFIKPMSLMLAIFTVSQLSGQGAVIHYCIQMIAEITGPELAYLPTLILDTCRFLSSIVLSIYTQKYGIRILILFSGISTSAFLVLLSLVTLLNLWTPWLSLIILFAYEIVVVMGLSSLPWAFCSELFSPAHKEIGVSVSTCYNYVLFFIILKFNQSLFLTLQAWGAFLLYGALTTIGSAVLYFTLPDTKNKSLKEIELMFLKK